MIATGEIIQIKSFLSVPYTSITQADIACSSPEGTASPTQSIQKASSICSGRASATKTLLLAQTSSTASSINNASAGQPATNLCDQADDVQDGLGAKVNRKNMKKRGRPPNGIKKDKTKREHKKHSGRSSGLTTPSRAFYSFLMELSPRLSPKTILSPGKILLGFKWAAAAAVQLYVVRCFIQERHLWVLARLPRRMAIAQKQALEQLSTSKWLLIINCLFVFVNIQLLYFIYTAHRWKNSQCASPSMLLPELNSIYLTTNNSSFCLF
mgnify:CR=1 FL=1